LPINDFKEKGKRKKKKIQICGTGTGTRGTVIFCRIVTGLGSGSNMRYNNKNSQKIKNYGPTFWEIILLLTLKRRDIV
jgi:hypothetical protein